MSKKEQFLSLGAARRGPPPREGPCADGAIAHIVASFHPRFGGTFWIYVLYVLYVLPASFLSLCSLASLHSWTSLQFLPKTNASMRQSHLDNRSLFYTI